MALFKTRYFATLLLAGCLLIFLFHGCAGTPQPKRIDNVCEIFRENSDWYEDAFESYKTWGIPIPVMMAILDQESKYIGDIRPPRTTCLWIFPGPRPSSAYGYAQALDGTWEEYKESTGNSWADRDDFGDSIEYFKINVLRFKPYHWYDLIWSAGLFDYFKDKHFVYMINKYYKYLVSGGEFIIGNFSHSNPTRRLMEVLSDWYLVHRSKYDLVRMALEAEAKEEQVKVDMEELGVNLFLRIKAA